MKLSTTTCLLSLAPLASGFATQQPIRSTSASTALPASRREFVDAVTGATLGSILVGGANAAQATEIDFEKVQDLLGTSAQTTTQSYAPSQGGKRPTYLTEPTEEFKKNEQK